MSSESYFIRKRGRVDGPFTPAEVAKMLRRGELAGIDDVSEDGLEWAPASTLEPFFQKLARARAQNAGLASSPPDVSQSAPPVPQAQPETLYYYSTQGTDTVGPLSMQALQSLARNGTLKPHHMVWTRDDRRSQPASQINGLWGIYAENVSLTSDLTVAALLPELEDPRVPVLKRLNRLALASGFSIAVLLLFCLNVPHGNRSGGLAFWWHLIGQSGQLPAVVFSFYVLLIGLGLLSVTGMLKGVPRGWTFVGTGGVGLLLLAAAGAVTKGSGLLLPLAMLAPSLCIALLLSVLSYRSPASEAGYVRTVQTIAGGLACGTSAGVMIIGAIGLGDLKSSAGAGSAWFATSLAVVGVLTGIACGILGIVDRRSPEKPKIAAAVVLGIVAMAIPLLAGLTIGFASAGSSRWILVRILRLVIVGYGLITLCAIGLRELLVQAGSARPGEETAHVNASGT